MSDSLISLIFGEQNERFTHIAHLNWAELAIKMSDLLTVAQRKWVNEQMSDDRMSEFPALGQNVKKN